MDPLLPPRFLLSLSHSPSAPLQPFYPTEVGLWPSTQPPRYEGKAEPLCRPTYRQSLDKATLGSENSHLQWVATFLYISLILGYDDMTVFSTCLTDICGFVAQVSGL